MISVKGILLWITMRVHVPPSLSVKETCNSSHWTTVCYDLFLLYHFESCILVAVPLAQTVQLLRSFQVAHRACAADGSGCRVIMQKAWLWVIVCNVFGECHDFFTFNTLQENKYAPERLIFRLTNSSFFTSVNQYLLSRLSHPFLIFV